MATDRGCFRFTSFEFGARCCECGRYAEAHEIAGKFYCAACCPSCRPVKPFADEPLPETLEGEQKGLF